MERCVDSSLRAQARTALLGWYDANHRLLPWRVNRHSRRAPSETADAAPQPSWTAVALNRSAPAGLSTHDFAYGVLVSEVMLQQTQVERAQTFFVGWMRRWPTLASLAAATEEEVNAAWAGLGYYRRARFLLQGAKFAVQTGEDKLPSTVPELLRVPGIGPYTAAAVASIAFGQRAAAVDGAWADSSCRPSERCLRDALLQETLCACSLASTRCLNPSRRARRPSRRCRLRCVVHARARGASALTGARSPSLVLCFTAGGCVARSAASWRLEPSHDGTGRHYMYASRTALRRLSCGTVVQGAAVGACWRGCR